MGLEHLPSRVLIASPAGFCAGVERALNIIEEEQRSSQEPIFGLHEVIHNKHESQRVAAMGVTFVEDPNDIPEGSTAIISAHGASPEVWQQLKEKKLRVRDATCPLVAKVHIEVTRAVRESIQNGKIAQIIYIGHGNHREAEGVLGEAPNNIFLIESPEDVENLNLEPEQPKFVFTQTTFSQDETRQLREKIKLKYPDIREPKIEDVCFATQNRQDGVKEMVEQGAGFVLVLGSRNSSNSNRLREVAISLGTRSELIDDVTEFENDWIKGVNIAGITAGASASRHRIGEVVAYLKALGVNSFQRVWVKDEKFEFSNRPEIYDYR